MVCIAVVCGTAQDDGERFVDRRERERERDMDKERVPNRNGFQNRIESSTCGGNRSQLAIHPMQTSMIEKNCSIL